MTRPPNSMFFEPLGSFLSIQALLSQGVIPFRTITIHRLVTINTSETAMALVQARLVLLAGWHCSKVPDDVPYCQDDYVTPAQFVKSCHSPLSK